MSVFHIGSLAIILMTGALFSKENLNVLESIAAKKETLKLITEDWKAEISEIDQEIDKLKNQRNLYLAKATHLQNQGDRLQFENNNLIDARRAWQQAQIHREIATRIQEEIDTLEKRKNQILEAHGITGGEKRESSNSNK